MCMCKWDKPCQRRVIHYSVTYTSNSTYCRARKKLVVPNSSYTYSIAILSRSLEGVSTFSRDTKVFKDFASDSISIECKPKPPYSKGNSNITKKKFSSLSVSEITLGAKELVICVSFLDTREELQISERETSVFDTQKLCQEHPRQLSPPFFYKLLAFPHTLILSQLFYG